MSDDDFEVVAVETPKIELDIPRDKLSAFIKLVEDLGWDKRKLKRYISTGLRLRKLEREYGKSYAALARNYQKLSSEEVKLKYSIEQLLEKRKKIEEDLQLYLEQHKLTLDLVQRIAAIADALRERGLDLEDLEKTLNVVENLKNLGYSAEEVLKKLEDLRNLNEEAEKLRSKLEEAEKAVEEAERKKEEILNEIKEIYGVSGELSELRDDMTRMREEMQKAEEELEEKRRDLEAVKSEIEQTLGVKATIEELQNKIQELRGELGKLEEEKEKLTSEVAELLEVKENIDDIREKIAENRRKLEEIEKEISNREAYLDILEGEISAAYTVLKLFTDPHGMDAEDLEALVDHLQKILKIKRGELPALKPLEPHLLNRARENIISLILPYVKNEFVPKKLFDQLEKEVRKLNEKRETLEEELASLRRALESRGAQAERAGVVAGPRITAYTRDGEPVELKSLGQGKRVKIRCPACKSVSIVSIPTKEELEEIRSKDYVLKFTCGECGKEFEIPIEILLKYAEV